MPNRRSGDRPGCPWFDDRDLPRHGGGWSFQGAFPLPAGDASGARRSADRPAAEYGPLAKWRGVADGIGRTMRAPAARRRSTDRCDSSSRTSARTCSKASAQDAPGSTIGRCLDPGHPWRCAPRRAVRLLNEARRHMTKREQVLLALRLEPLYSEQAKERMSKGGKKSGQTRRGEGGVKNTPPSKREPRARDQAAKAANVNAQNVDRAKRLRRAARSAPSPSLPAASWTRRQRDGFDHDHGKQR